MSTITNNKRNKIMSILQFKAKEQFGRLDLQSINHSEAITSLFGSDTINSDKVDALMSLGLSIEIVQTTRSGDVTTPYLPYRKDWEQRQEEKRLDKIKRAEKALAEMKGE